MHKILTILIFIASCGKYHNKKDIPGNITEVQKLQSISVENKINHSIDSPRQNRDIVLNTSAIDDGFLVNKNLKQDIEFILADEFKGHDLMEHPSSKIAIHNIKDQVEISKTVHFGRFKKESDINAVSAMLAKHNINIKSYKDGDFYVVNSDKIQKDEAYRIANLAVKQGYYDVEVK